MADWVKTNQEVAEVAMTLEQIELSLDPRVVARLKLLAEEQRITLADLIAVVLNQHVDDVHHLEAQVDAGETTDYTLQQEQAGEFSPLLAWLRMSPEARWDAVERGLVQPPWAELEAAETADDATPV